MITIMSRKFLSSLFLILATFTASFAGINFERNSLFSKKPKKTTTSSIDALYDQVQHDMTATKAVARPAQYTIVGGSRGAGWALAQHLLQDDKNTVKLFVRKPKSVASKYKHNTRPPQILSGEATKLSEVKKLVNATRGSDYLVIAQSFPYKIWEDSLRALVANCIEACRQTGATLIYFGRVYKFGLLDKVNGTTDPIIITESSLPQPNSVQGGVLHDIERAIENAATSGPAEKRIKARIITHSYPVGRNLGDGMVDDNFSGIAKNPTRGFFSSKRAFRWVGNKKNGLPKMQITFTDDLARFTPTYLNSPSVLGKQFDRVNFGGHSLSSIEELARAYSAQAGDLDNYELSTYNKSGLSGLAIVNKEAKRAADVFYAFTHEILLANDDEHAPLLERFERTPFDRVVQNIHNYYDTKK